MANNFYVADFLFLKSLIFTLIITCFKRLRMHQITPFLAKKSGEHAPGPPTTSVNQHH